VEYLKYDDCGEVNLNSFAKFQAMRDSLNATGVHMVYSYEPHTTNPISWPPQMGNSWRTGHDIRDSYASMMSELPILNAWANIGGPGAFNDGDILEVGNPGLSVSEARTHFAAWCLVKSPLLIGCDLTTVGEEFLEIMRNKDLIAISQDPLGEQGKLVSSSKGPSGLQLPPLSPA